MIRERPYRVRGELGEYTLEAYEDASASTCIDIFPPQRGKSYYQTAGFRRRYVHEGCQQKSYRLVSDAYRKETYQEVNCSSRSLQDMVVAEGKKVNKVLQSKSLGILQEYGIVHKRDKTQVSEQTQVAVIAPQYMDVAEVTAAYDAVKSKCDDEVADKLEIDLAAYECPQQTINISNDDVCVKEQKNKRKGLSEQEVQQQQQARQQAKQRVNGRKVHKKRKYVYQNVTHFECKGKQYKIIGERLSTQLNSITAFLLYNEGLDYNWTFYVDGHGEI